jgi:hypothetical protein
MIEMQSDKYKISLELKGTLSSTDRNCPDKWTVLYKCQTNDLDVLKQAMPIFEKYYYPYDKYSEFSVGFFGHIGVHQLIRNTLGTVELITELEKELENNKTNSKEK